MTQKQTTDNRWGRSRRVYRSTIAGCYVTEEFALQNPDTTVSETIKKSKDDESN